MPVRDMSKLFSDELKLTARDALGGIYPPAQGEEPGGLPLTKLLAAAFRSRYLVIGTTLFGILIGAFLAITTPNTFVSTGKFISMGQGAERISLDPTNVSQASHELIGSSATYVMLSEEVLKRVIAKMTPARILAPYRPDGDDGGMRGFFHSVQADWNAATGTATEEDALKRLKKAITVDRPRFTEMLICSCAANDARLAQEILGTFMTEAQAHHLEVYDDPKVFDSTKKRAEEAAEARQSAHRAMRDFLEREAQVQDFDFELKHLREAAFAAATNWENHKSEVVLVTKQIAALEKRLSTIEPQKSGFRKPTTANLTSGIDTQINLLQAEIARLNVEGATSGAQERLEKQITELRKRRLASIAEAQSAPDEPYVEPNPEYREVEEDLATQKNDLAKLQAVVEDKGKAAEQARTSLRRLQDLEPRFQILRDALIRADDEVKNTANAFAAAETKKRLKLGNFSSLNLVEPASRPLEKEGPNRGKLILGGFFVGLFLGLGIIIMRTLPDNVVRTREDLERVDGIAVIGVMPRLENRNLKRHRVLREQGW